MANFVDRPGRSPYVEDDTRRWVEANRVNNLAKPQCLLRFATDTNYIHNQQANLYNPRQHDFSSLTTNTKCIMNLALPGMRVPGVLNWSVTEQLDNVVQTATFEALNALPISETTAQLEGDLAGVLYGKNNRADNVSVWGTWAQDSLGAVRQVTGPGTTDAYDQTNNQILDPPGNDNIGIYYDHTGYRYQEKDVKYRIFENQIMELGEGWDRFPDPRIPNDDDNDVSEDEKWPDADSGNGSYFVLIGNEVIRVIGYANDINGVFSTNPSPFFVIAPGGRAVNGILEEHKRGDTVYLLGYGPYTGDWCAMGYLNLDDYAPQASILRPGTCLVSYEGYGDITGKLSHDYDDQRNYQFTGYWFITGVEPSLADDGVPKVKVDLKGTGYMFDKQKITPDIVRRAKNQFDQWHIAEKYGKANGKTIWAAAGQTRDIPGDWVDYNSWDPTLPGSYPLKIQTELAQHKAFFDHMTQTNYGAQCEICHKEVADWEKTHTKGGKNAFKENRAVGKHIYKESIRVMHPITTYIRLMATLAAAAWDHPSIATDLAQRFTKLPNQLFDNMRNVEAGLVYNGQIIYDTKNGGDKNFDWFNPTYDDTKVHGFRDKLACPFDSSYDQAPFWQPMQDLADLNGCIITITREGYPVFVPRLFSTRPEGHGFKTLNQDPTKGPVENLPPPREGFGGVAPLEWHLSYGGSISGYSPSTNTDSIITQCWISANTALDGTTVQVITGGTGYQGKSRVFYSGLGGNREGLMFTSGVQQTDQFEISNLVLGLEWDTNYGSTTGKKNSGYNTGWGPKFIDKNGDQVIQVSAPLYEGSEDISKKTSGRVNAKIKIQRTINFFIQRQLMPPYQVNGDWVITGVDATGNFGDKTEAGVKQLQNLVSMSTDGVYTKELTKKLKAWLNDHIQYVKNDPMWYVKQPFGWTAFVSAMTGAPLVVNTKANITPGQGDDYIPDQVATQKAVANWAKGFSKSMINIGARRVDESIDKATARSITTNLADPRIICGDLIWADVPGFVEPTNVRGNMLPPFTNGIYVTQVNRQMDLQAGSYTGSYSGYRYRADFQQRINPGSLKVGWKF